MPGTACDSTGGECAELKVLRAETEKDLGFQAKMLADTLEETRECLTEVNNVNKSLVENLSAVNASMKAQNEQLIYGRNRFESIEGSVFNLREKCHDIDNRLSINEVIVQEVPNSRQFRTYSIGFGASAGGIVVLFVEIVLKVISMVTQ